jgi:PAS domain S-box-containing protein
LEKNDTLYVGTDDGFFYLENDELQPVIFDANSINQPIYAILEDETGSLWFGTDAGVIQVKEKRIRNFNENNGLIGNDVSRGALVLAGSGRVIIGTQNGVSVYIPEEDYVRPIAPLVNVDKLTVNSVDEQYVNHNLTIPYALNSIAITYSAVSFSSLPQLVVEYRLEGFHNDWSQIENPRNNQLYFNNLPPGKYRLALKASYSGQFESDVAYSPEFFIAKPFYLQLWFIVIVIIFFIAVGMIINMLFLQFKNQDILKTTLDEKTSEIRHREDQFRNVWDSSQDGLMLSVFGGKVIAANPALCRMGNVKEEDLKQKGLSYLFSDPKFYENVREKVLQETLESSEKNGFMGELTVPFKTGKKEIELIVSLMEADYEGKPFFLNVFRDVSSKKAYEQGLKYAKEKAEEVSKLKSSILSNMGHEVRTPLNGILGSTENMIQSRAGDRELIEQLEIIKESGERLLQTMNNILDLSRIESNRMNVVYEDTNIKDFISKILIHHRSLAIKKGILVSVRFLNNSFVAKVDRKYLEIIINNIVGNAIKYTDKGMIHIVTEKKGKSLFFQVKDEGIGISEAYLQRLFHPFEQESKGYDRKFEGSGIGLAITKHLVELLSGHIKIESEKGKGTVVTITLPLDP